MTCGGSDNVIITATTTATTTIIDVNKSKQYALTCDISHFMNIIITITNCTKKPQ